MIQRRRFSVLTRYLSKHFRVFAFDMRHSQHLLGGSRTDPGLDVQSHLIYHG
jgi:hypothetical protein